MPSIYGIEEVISNLNKWGKQKEKRIQDVSERTIAPMLESYAKKNRPWKDRTGNARRGLHAKVVVTASDLAIQLHHGVYYGVYLELSRAGKYAILRPTMDNNKAEIIRLLKSAWGE